MYLRNFIYLPTFLCAYVIKIYIYIMYRITIESERRRLTDQEVTQNYKLDAEADRMISIQNKNLALYKVRWKDHQVAIKRQYLEKIHLEQLKKRIEEAKKYKEKLEEEREKRANALMNFLQQKKTRKK